MSDPLDLEYLTAFAREQQAASESHNRRGGDRCPKCPHGWHGAQCQVTAYSLCLCETSWEPA